MLKKFTAVVAAICLVLTLLPAQLAVRVAAATELNPRAKLEMVYLKPVDSSGNDVTDNGNQALRLKEIDKNAGETVKDALIHSDGTVGGDAGTAVGDCIWVGMKVSGLNNLPNYKSLFSLSFSIIYDTEYFYEGYYDSGEGSGVYYDDNGNPIFMPINENASYFPGLWSEDYNHRGMLPLVGGTTNRTALNPSSTGNTYSITGGNYASETYASIVTNGGSTLPVTLGDGDEAVERSTLRAVYYPYLKSSIEAGNPFTYSEGVLGIFRFKVKKIPDNPQSTEVFGFALNNKKFALGYKTVEGIGDADVGVQYDMESATPTENTSAFQYYIDDPIAVNPFKDGAAASHDVAISAAQANGVTVGSVAVKQGETDASAGASADTFALTEGLEYTVTATATDADEYYEFDKWQYDGSDTAPTISGMTLTPASNVLTVKLESIASGTTLPAITAVFKKKTPTFTTGGANGSVKIYAGDAASETDLNVGGSNSVALTAGETYTLVAAPTDAENYSFTSWAASPAINTTGGTAVNGNTNATISFVMPGDAQSITATFTEKGSASATVGNITLTAGGSSATSPVNAGSQLDLAVAVSGAQPTDAKVTYQWAKKGNGDAWDDIKNATNATYTVSTSGAGTDSGTYRVTVTVTDENGVYKTTTYEKEFALSVLDPMAGAAVSIASDKTDNKVNESEKITLTATPSITTPSGITPAYQWQKKGTGDSGFANISSATNATLEITAAAADDGAQYQCVATFTAAGYQQTVVTSAPLTIDVAPFISGTVSITSSSASNSVVQNTAVTLTASDNNITGGAVAKSYKWYSKTGGGEYGVIPDATASTYTPSTAATGTTTYKVEVVYELTDYQDTTKSAEYTLTVTEAPDITASISASPASASIAKGGSQNFEVNVAMQTPANYDMVTYKWYKEGASETTLSTTEQLAFPNAALTDAGTYKCDVVVTAAGYKQKTATVSATLEVLDLFTDTIATQPAAARVDIGGSQSLSVALSTPTTEGATPTYQWYKEAGETDTPVGTNSATLSFGSATLADDGTYYCVITLTKTGFKTAILTSNTATLTVNPYTAATITGPTNASGVIGGSATFSVALSNVTPAAGYTPTYQWYQENGVTDISVGGNSDTLTITDLTIEDHSTKQYYCIVTISAENYTTESFTSGTATLTVSTRPTVIATASGPNDLTVNVGENAEFSVALSGITEGTNTPTYKWYKKGPSDGDFALIDSEEGNTLSLTAVSADMTGTQYKVDVEITKADYDPYIYSKTVTLTVLKIMNVAIEDHPAPAQVDEGTSATFTVTTTLTDPSDPDEITYQWYKVGETDTPVGEDSATLTIPGDVANSGSSYYCVITLKKEGYADETLETNPALLTVNPQITATVTGPTNATVTEVVDSTATFTVGVSEVLAGAADATPTYKWFKENGETDIELSNGDDYDGVTTATLTVKAPTKADDDGAKFYCKVTIAKSGFATFEDETDLATLTVNEQPSVTATVTGPDNQSKRPGESVTFTVNVTGITADADAPTYVWSKSADGDAWETIADTDNSITIDNLTLGDDGTKYKVVVTITKTNYITLTEEKIVTLTVNDLPYATGTVTKGTNVTVYEGQSATLSVTVEPADDNTAAQCQWYKDGVLIEGATGATYTIPAAAVADAGSYECKVTFSKADHNPTMVEPGAITLTVDELGTLDASITSGPEDTEIVENEDATFEVVPYVTPSEGVTITYKWFEELGETDGLIEDATTAVLELQEVSADKNGSQYYCEVKFEKTGYTTETIVTDPATLTVIKLMDVAITDPEDATVDEGEDATFTVAATATDPEDADITYQWYKEAGETDTPVGGNSATLTIENVTEDDDNTSYYCIATFTKGGYKTETKTSEPATLTVERLMDVAITDPEDVTVDEGEDATFTVAATATTPADATITYQWYKEAGETDTPVGENSATLTLDDVAADLSGDQYYCEVTFEKAGYKTTEKISATATLTVIGAIQATITNPENARVKKGANATFTVTATATDPADATVTYQWYKEAGETDTPVGENSATLTIENVTEDDDNTSYYCIATFTKDGYKTTEKTSEPATLNVNVKALSKIMSNESTNGTYTFTIGEDGDTFDGGDEKADVEEGTIVTVNTKANKNYSARISVVHAEDADIVVDVNEYGEFTMPAHDVIITVRFSKDNSGTSYGGGGVTSYKVTYDLDSKGTIAGGGKNTEVVNSGAKPKAVPAVAANEGYKFVGWTLDGEMVDPTTVIVKTAITFVAAYEEILIPKNYIKPYAKGYEDGSFLPDKEISRAELSAMIARIIYGDELPDGVYFSSFPDVERNAWYSKYIGFLEDKNVLTGYEDGTFRPLNSVTRGEFCTIVARAQKYDLITYSGQFGDVTENDWAKDFIATLADHNIVEGYEDGSFGPYLPLTRAEAVAIINRVLAPSTPIITFTPGDIAGHWAEADIMLAVNERNILE